MPDNPLLKLEKLGQSIWLDFIRREAVKSGELAGLIKNDGISGVTSNPSIFEKAIAGSHDYDEAVRAMALEGKSVEEIYRTLTVEDIKDAADLFRPVYDRTSGGDGYVSIEVSPDLAHDSARTVEEARQLWKAVGKPNIYIKVPGTAEGLDAIRQLISEGINVNVTLLFGLPRYQEVAEAYLSGLEARAENGEPVDGISSVASFFLSRIDSLVDKVFEEKIQKQSADTMEAVRARGQVAISSAKLAYEMYDKLFGGERFKKLESKGARRQRLLWASTSTKNPSYSDVKYVEALIGPDTVNTLPLETLNSYRDHGDPTARLEIDVDSARRVMERIPALGVDIDQVTQQLEDEGVRKFSDAYAALMKPLEDKKDSALHQPVDKQSFSLGSLEKELKDRIEGLGHDHFAARLWQKDPSLWKNDETGWKAIKNQLGWLHVAEKLEEVLDDISEFAEEVRKAGFRHVVHMGMGGSSLAPFVLRDSFSLPEGGIPLTVLDTTDPATILKTEKDLPLSDTLFIVASKSGSTAEPNAFADYFYDKVKALKGSYAGDNFVAITDPGSKLIGMTNEKKFRRTFLNYADVGGRYSALSYFGLVPAALLGLNIHELIARALRMVHACASCVPADKNPGLALGAVMGGLALKGRDKVTFVISKRIGTLGLWLEQLIAESTGKEGKGILPVCDEPLMDPDNYGNDRLFVHIKLKGDDDREINGKIDRLIDAGHPVVAIQLDDAYDMGQEFFRWEVAVAAAGSLLGVNPFDQQNVQESKDNTDRILGELKSGGKLQDDSPAVIDADISVYGNVKGKNLTEVFSAFYSGTKPGDYAAFMAFTPMSNGFEEKMAAIRKEVSGKLKIASTFGYGPRFLHSTGQFHKGGPNTGLFVQFTAGDVSDAPIPGRPFGFSVLKKTQAIGDMMALREHDRRVIRLDLGRDVSGGMDKVIEAIRVALS